MFVLASHDSKGFVFVADSPFSHDIMQVANSREARIFGTFQGSVLLVMIASRFASFFVFCLKIPFVDPSDAVLRDTHNCTVRFP